jgi:predicted acylesterase/phospholipase RssA
LSKKIFKKDQVLVGLVPTGDRMCRFDHNVFEDVIKQLINEKLKDPSAPMADPTIVEYKPCPMFIVANSAANADSPPVLFRSYNRTGQSAAECHIWQAARATTAAPLYFKPMRIEDPRPGPFYVDARGLRHNNPEAHHLWPSTTRFCLVSIRTGRQQTVEFVNIDETAAELQEESSSRHVRSVALAILGSRLARTVANTRRGVGQLKRIAEACVKRSTSSEPVHQDLFKRAYSQGLDRGLRYHRFNVEKGMDSIGLEEWKANSRLAQLTDDYMRESEAEKKRNDCVKDLLDPNPTERM